MLNTIPAIENAIREYVETSGFEIADENALNDVARKVHFENEAVDFEDLDIEALDAEFGFIK